MIKEVKQLFDKEGIEYVSVLPFENCTVTREHILRRCNARPASVICFAVPYFTGEGERLSAYAVSRDYHSYMSELTQRICRELVDIFPQNTFAGFADSSPIDEREACARSGVGVVGKNGLLITEKYSSYVFLGEIITDVEPQTLGFSGLGEVKHCIGCGKCKELCPMMLEGCECISALSQKKGVLTEEEEGLLIKYNTVWGCDICQRACPYTERALNSGSIYTPIEFFRKDRIASLSSEIINGMSDAEFLSRAYSWRGRDTLLRNLKLFEE